MKSWMIVGGVLLVFAMFALYKATAPPVATQPAAGVTAAPEPVAWDAHRRISDIQHDVTAMRWMTLFSVLVASLSAMAAYQAWDFARSHGNRQTLEARLRALEGRQTVFLPTPTQYSSLFSEEEPEVAERVVSQRPPVMSVPVQVPNVTPRQPVRPPVKQAAAVVPLDLVNAFPQEAEEPETTHSGEGVIG